MYIMCVCLFSTLSRKVGALQISIIIIFIFDFGRLQAKLHFLQKRQDNAVTWCNFILVTMLLNISCVI